MSNTPANPQELVMVLYQDKNRSAGHFYLRACPKHLREDGGMSNGIGELVNGWNIDDLEISAWYSQEYPELNFGRMYDSIRYMNVYQMGATEAMQKAKTLERLERSTRNGVRALTFGDYVAKVAKTMKIKRFKVCTHSAPLFSESTYVDLTLEQAIKWLNSKGEKLPESKKVG